MRIIRAAEHRVMPWKNGGGTTREVLVAPGPLDPSRFQWRVSIATVAQAGPFSRFPGIDRSIAVMQGSGIRLRLGDDIVSLDQRSQPFNFPGEADVQSELIDGETIDLNVMTMRSGWTHSMRRLRLEQEAVLTGGAAITVLAFAGPASVSAGTVEAHIELFDVLAEIGLDDQIRIASETPADMFVIELDPVAA